VYDISLERDEREALINFSITSHSVGLINTPTHQSLMEKNSLPLVSRYTIEEKALHQDMQRGCTAVFFVCIPQIS
jgi:hypothetical protein